MFEVTKYWCKAQKCIIWQTNTKPFFQESEADLDTFQKRSPYIEVWYKFVFKSFKSLNRRIFWANGILAQGFIMPNLVAEYKTIFFEKWGKPWNSPKTFSPYWSFSIIGVISIDCDYCFFEFFECCILNCQIFNWR